MRNYDILILGIETTIGQKIYSLLEQDYDFLTVAVPFSNYSQSTIFPQNQVKINFLNDANIKSIVSSFKLIVAFDHKKVYQKLMISAKSAFLDVSTFSFQMVIEILKQKIQIPFQKTKIELNFIASKRNIFKFLFYPKRDFFPVSNNGIYNVKIKEVDMLSESLLTFNLLFTTSFCAYLFTIIGSFLRPFIYLFQLFGISANIPFNENRTSENSICIKWQEKKELKKNQSELFQYYINPNQDEYEVMSEYFRLNLICILQLQNPYNKYKFKSINVQPHKTIQPNNNTRVSNPPKNVHRKRRK